jgi:hypothetical protein
MSTQAGSLQEKAASDETSGCMDARKSCNDAEVGVYRNKGSGSFIPAPLRAFPGT